MPASLAIRPFVPNILDCLGMSEYCYQFLKKSARRSYILQTIGIEIRIRKQTDPPNFWKRIGMRI